MIFFSGKSIYPIGLDISDLSLKLVQFNKIGNKIIFQALSKYNLPEGFISDGEIKNQVGVIKAIKNLINKPKFGKVSSNNVVACLPETKTFVKLIKIDKTPNSIADIIETEIGKHVPMLVDDIFYDWQVIEEKNDSQLILIGAAPKNIINQYTNLFDQANLSIEALEIEPAAICRSLLKEESINYKGPFEKNYAIIDIGATRTSLTLYSKNTILFT
ncbi:MAG: pilus assembly protein PilM, partial [Patescibacteria group bacterium]